MRFLVEEYLTEMAALRKERTGLPINIWIDEFGAKRNVPHFLPRVKIQSSIGNDMSNLASVSISEHPMIIRGVENIRLSGKDLQKVIAYIKENYKLFLKVWNDEIDFDELKQALADKGMYKLNKD